MAPSHTEPSASSPSPITVYTRALLLFIFSARAMPTQTGRPCPREPEFISMPGSLLLGWPINLLPKWENSSITWSMGKKPFAARHSVQSLYRMSLAQHKFVSAGIREILGPHIHLMKIQRNQNIHYAHVSADMSRFSGHYHADHILAKFKRFCR